MRSNMQLALVILCFIAESQFSAQQPSTNLDLVTTQASTNSEAQNLYLYSSLERSGRHFSCPIEMVSFSCAVKGPILMWIMDDIGIPGIFFERNDTVYTGKGHEGDCFIFSALLDAIKEIDGEYFCYSTLTITPGRLSPNLTLEQPCNQSSSHMIQCTSNQLQDQSPVDMLSTQYNIAGISNIIIPGPCDGSTCKLNTMSSSASVVIGVPPVNDINANLSYYTVELRCDDIILGTNRVTPFAEVGKKHTTTFSSVGLLRDCTHVAARIKAFDQCGQQSLQPLDITCKGSKAGFQVRGIFAYVMISIMIALAI